METILCPTNFSPSSENAIRYADQIAHWMQARMILFHNIDEPAASNVKSFGGVLYAEPIRDPAQYDSQMARLNAWKDKLAAVPGSQPIPYKTLIRYGLTQDNIIEEVVKSQADLVVLGGKPGHSLIQIYSSSVMDDLIKLLPCPVLIIPPNVSFKPFTNIVIATSLLDDFTSGFSLVSKLATLFQAKVSFIHIVRNYSTYEQEKAKNAYYHFKKKLLQVETAFYVATHASIEEGISYFASRFPIDLLIMGYHAHGAWEGFFHVDLTKRMVHNTSLPLLIIPNS